MIRTMCATGLACIVVFTPRAIAQDVPPTETPEAIAAVLQAKCLPCHGPETQKHGLRLDTLEFAQKGGESGQPALVPGDAFGSALVKRISLPAEHADVMPPAGKPALSADETLAIIHWINRGAAWSGVAAEPAPEAPVPGVSFATQIKPILDASCIKCHGAERQKGDLRLDSPEAIQKGSENGAVFVAGKPEESLIYNLVILPPDHPDVMPGQGDPLTAEQAELIRKWVFEGAVFDALPEGTIVAAPAAPQGPSVEEVLATLAQGVTPAPVEALTAIEGWGALALPLDQKTPLLQIDLQRATTGVGDDQLSQLASLASQVTWLNLAGTDVTDEDLAQVAQLQNLTKLHLERTGITDAGLAHLTALKHLHYLNLYGTKISDAGIAHLTQIPSLRKVFVWQTGVTKDGAAQLAQANPELAIDLGWEPEAPAAAAEPAKFDEGSCCAKAVGEGKECDHPCCVEARAAGKVCEKCNPNTAAALAAGAVPPVDAPVEIATIFDDGSCCAKALAEGKECDHPCCVEARAAGKVCDKCNPNVAAAAAAAVPPAEALAPAVEPAKFDEGSCCAKAVGEGKECDHPCCVEARAAGTVCKKCNPNAA